ncbi:hypothetical protein B7P43_G00938 [Cryptotermes secundus]|uniref:tRNA 2-thiocytidine biosynthesis protein TtcA n=3 Tax=Cryptotermes secundus TaxID=105785 RepID=A0A2J7PG66_9NEOP|nr:hypothetical protein B7P43_G00938 [Cryptotermes secundus]
MQSTLFRHEARDIFRNAVHASEHDAVIFAGHGCTGAVHKLIHALNLVEPPIVFVGPCEHHSNLLPWREKDAKIVRIAERKDGFLDLDDLESQLQLHQGTGRQLIGCFSAASNITGILADDVATTLLLHQYGALAFWDYAAAAPYVKLDMNPFLPGVDERAVYKDAMFFSVHKFVGGVQTPGILIAKKALFKNTVPNGCGGGTVFFVTRDSHRYLQDTELREEGGTAAVVESVRAGLVMQLKETIGVQAIMAREEKISRMVLAHIRTIPELILLGSSSQSVKRLPIFSFMVRHPRGTFLHHNFVCTVLNDVFGIQARGGCACAGPYAQDLLGIDEHLAQEYETVLLEDSRLDRTHLRRREEHSSFEMLRPGFARISLPFFMSDSEVAFVLEALKMVATEAWKLLPQYILYPETGEWRHHTNIVFRDRKWLGSIRYVDGKMTVNERRVSGHGTFPPQDYAECLHTARSIFNKARKMAQRYPLADQCVMFDENTNRLRWFMLPSEAQDLLLGNSQNVKHDVPFDPVEYSGSRRSVAEALPAPLNATNGALPVSVSLSRPTYFVSPRHNSLPCTDHGKAEVVTPPTISVMCPPLLNVSSGSEGSLDKHKQKSYADGQSPLHFAVGEVMNPAAVMTKLPTGVAKNIINEQLYPPRTRCHSLGSFSGISPILSPQKMGSLGIGDMKEWQCSCSSQTDLSSLEVESTSSLNFLQLSTLSAADCNVAGRSSPTASSVSTQSPEDLQAYVKEVTKELATEIKSEIREVISKVEDVLSESTDSAGETCGSFHQHLASSSMDKLHSGSGEIAKSDSVSANDVAEYLMEFSREMASEMKSEIREMVNAVDVLISPDAQSHEEKSSSADSPVDTPGTHPGIAGCVNTKLGDLSGERTHSSECSSDETVVHILSADPKKSQTADNGTGSNETDEEEDDVAADNRRHHQMRSTINSISSQDSGINLTFQESDSSSHGTTEKRSSELTSTHIRKTNSLSDSSISVGGDAKLATTSQQLVSVPAEMSSEAQAQQPVGNIVTPADHVARWHCPPKSIWKPAIEALQEFDMIRDGDRVMVCLSGGKDSLSLLHTLHQYQFYAKSKGIHYTLGAATVDPGSSAYDPRPLVPYLQALGVHYLYEEQAILQQAAALEKGCKSVCSFCSRMKRGRLYAAARSHGYNVLALGQHLDDLVESFLMSVFHNGRLRSMKAHYYIRERDLRVIRPFVYVREKTLRQFAESRNLPIIPENCPACFDAPKERHRVKQLLAQQEILFPRLFWSLRSALHPLISFRHTGEESRIYTRHRKQSQSHGMHPTSDALSSDTEEEPVS